MTTADAVRSRSFLPLESDIPSNMTIAEYRTRRSRSTPRPRRTARRRTRRSVVNLPGSQPG
jgi:hypothetical protein